MAPENALGGGPLAPTTDLIVGAHPDDVELLGLTAIGDPAATVTAVVCTDGAGSRPPAGGSPPASVAVRRREQLAAATAGRYRQLVLLDHPSAAVRAGTAPLVAQLAEVVAAVRPARVITHNPADRHPTHVPVAAAVVAAIRSVPRCRPVVYGVELWRSLDWLPEEAMVVLDATGLDELGDRLLGVYTSQLALKPYDVAAAARRRANATFLHTHQPDRYGAAVFAMDLTPAAAGAVELRTLVAAHLDRFRASVLEALPPAGPS